MPNQVGKLFIGAVLALATLSTQAYAKEKPWAPGRILVQPKADVTHVNFNALMRRHGGEAIERIGKLDVHIVNVPVNAEAAVVEALSHNPQIEFAEKDYLYSLEATANDPYYSNAWHLETINAPEAWDGSRGEGVVVAVLDTGVDANHPDLQGQLLLPGWNSNNLNTDTADVHGHGTMVTGVVAARSNNNLGVTSIAWNAKILPVRVSLQSGSAYASRIARGLDWAADNGADVANISYAVTSSSAVQKAANRMRGMGGIVCISAGNDGDELSTVDHPAIITVSATNSNDALVGWSNYGNVIDLAAPGTGIYTTTRGGGYTAVSGTSFSSPITAATAALVMAADPTLSPAEVETILMENSADLGSPGQDIYFGHGRIDAAAAVTAALGGPGEDPLPDDDTLDPTVAITAPTGGTVTGQVTVSITASDDSIEGVSYVELYAGTTLVGTDSSSPYNINWDTTGETNGQIVDLTARAYDQTGNQGTSQTVTVEVDNPTQSGDTVPPTITILNPSASTTTVSGKRVRIQAAASDNVGIVSLELRIDGVIKKTTTSDSLTYRWNSTQVADGEHVITASASDAAGNSGSSSTTVTVSNGGTTDDGGGDTTTGGSEKGKKKCRDGKDNDGDGLIDGADPDCR